MPQSDLSFLINEISLPISYEDIYNVASPYIHYLQTHERQEYDQLIGSIRCRLRNANPTIWQRLIWLSKGAPFSQKGRKIRWDKKWLKESRYDAGYYAHNGLREPGVWRDQAIHIRNAGIVRARLQVAIKTISALRPRSILEVGCGDGLYSILLANRFPEISYRAIDLSTTGIKLAKKIQTHQTLSPHVTAFSPEEFLDPNGFKKIKFESANVAELGFSKNSFDLVFTCVALEQMESIRMKALSEIARVCDKWTIMFEPFSEFTDTPLRSEYKKFSHYFNASLEDLTRVGLKPVCVTDDMPQKSTLSVPLVVCCRA